MGVLKEGFIISIICGLGAIFAFLGEGEGDPFLAEADGDFSILYSTAIIAFFINFAVFIPSYKFQTEKFYDLTGSLTYITCTVYSLLAGARASARLQNSLETYEFGLKALIASGCTLLWCIRLGYFLFTRVLKVGQDSRFDKYKVSALSFMRVWLLQGLWVFLTAYCVFIINSEQLNDVTAFSDLAVTDYIGLVVFLVGYIIEVVADHQKYVWRQKEDKKHPFIDYGLWYYSRHPNYFGEMMLWWGILILALDSLEGTQFAALFSPIFVFVLINYMSGVPILEERSDEKFGDIPEYWEYKQSTSSLLPFFKGYLGSKAAGPFGQTDPITDQKE